MPTRHRYTRSSIEAQSILLRVQPLIASRLVVSPMSLERRSVVINLDGESYRLRDHHAAAETLRRTTTGTRQQLH